MSIMDGFWLWVGKVLAELALAGAFFAALAVGFVAFVLVAVQINKFKRWKKARKAPQASKGEAA